MAKQIKERLPDFAGRVVCFMFKGKELHQGLYLLDPYFERQAGDLFVVGNLPVDWDALADHLMSIRWDSVDGYIVADSIEAFSKTRKNLNEDS